MSCIFFLVPAFFLVLIGQASRFYSSCICFSRVDHHDSILYCVGIWWRCRRHCVYRLMLLFFLSLSLSEQWAAHFLFGTQKNIFSWPDSHFSIFYFFCCSAVVVAAVVVDKLCWRSTREPPTFHANRCYLSLSTHSLNNIYSLAFTLLICIHPQKYF